MTRHPYLPTPPEEFEAEARRHLSSLEQGQVLFFDGSRGPVHVMGEVRLVDDDRFEVRLLHDDGDDCLEWPPTEHSGAEVTLMQMVASCRGHRMHRV